MGIYFIMQIRQNTAHKITFEKQAANVTTSITNWVANTINWAAIQDPSKYLFS